MTYDKKAPIVSKKYRNLFLTLRCDCPARKYKDSKNKSNPCRKLTVIDLSDGEVEIDGVYLKAKSVQKLLKFLLEVRRGEAIIKLGKIK
jgi:hypothetical protein